jgi:hypothetical protein
MRTVAFWLDFRSGVNGARWGEGASERGMVVVYGPREVDMRKSALLGRLMRGEEVRRRPCPRHRGRMWCSWGMDEATRPCPCDGTGWLPNDYEGPMPASGEGG